MSTQTQKAQKAKSSKKLGARPRSRDAVRAIEQKALIERGCQIVEEYSNGIEGGVTFRMLKDYIFDDVYEKGDFGRMTDRLGNASFRCLVQALIERLTDKRDNYPREMQWAAGAFIHKLRKVCELPWFQSLLDNIWILAHVIDSDTSGYRTLLLSKLFAWRFDEHGTPKRWNNMVLRMMPEQEGKGGESKKPKKELYLAPIDEIVGAIVFRLRDMERSLRDGLRVEGSVRTWADLEKTQSVIAYMVSLIPEKKKIAIQSDEQEADDDDVVTGSDEAGESDVKEKTRYYFVDAWVHDVQQIVAEANILWDAKIEEWAEKQKEWAQRREHRERSGEQDQGEWHGSQQGSRRRVPSRKNGRQHHRYAEANAQASP